jgi:hypothetical protein
MPYRKGLFFYTLDFGVEDMELYLMLDVAKRKEVLLMKSQNHIPAGKKLIFRKYYISKSGQKVYPRNGKAFPMYVDE